ncbi:TrkH family potassium uptake protein [Helcobacillus massiliensis]|uniref:TrkH family potassium uptake protein n=1 Tax=Helcobacillus TaxID=1161125 RepID=UPI001EF6AC2F|nr:MULTISPECIES: potassium transporter TrkG [Helcobacillus]MCG7426741.1 TrkH family potassium uptake protein [Helcobacillus sp. ACRRO]MCT1557702.1 TrkH family potassium uptake protein [Helcobacillus massiliensis]MCT2035974.1 TrkH family potassium uptake protein [Helcobacillus massiliensis]MCT2331756.1 TrkH family potassium uptake protein [Helcobacillus massiliensis]MDK7742442.1 potassium transporter TrkG [Helcobacillus massiliensis]
MRATLTALQRPAALIALATAGVLALGTTLLMMPFSSKGEPPPFIDALFTATSALCVTGLVTLNTDEQWTVGGQIVLLCLMQIGGLGVMILVTMLALLTARHVGIRDRQVFDTATASGAGSHVRSTLRMIALVTIAVEGAVAVLLTLRMHTHYEMGWGKSAWYGVFHAVSAFNNAGFGLRSSSLIDFGTDPFVLLPIAGAIILGGIGYPVILEVLRRLRPHRILTLNSKLMLIGTPVLLFGGTLAVLVPEWSNPATLGPMNPAQKVLASFFQSTTSRTAGFNALDISQMHPETWFGTDILMFIGAGPAGTGGGLKVTSAAVVLIVILSELRGDTGVRAFHRAIPSAVIRQVVTVMGLYGLAVVVGTGLILLLEPVELDRVLYEVISAISTTGLSTGITADLSTTSRIVLIVLMFLGRVGPVTLGTALALRARPLAYTSPEERPIIG